jgi:hypothetical protein
MVILRLVTKVEAACFYYLTFVLSYLSKILKAGVESDRVQSKTKERSGYSSISNEPHHLRHHHPYQWRWPTHMHLPQEKGLCWKTRNKI